MKLFKNCLLIYCSLSFLWFNSLLAFKPHFKKPWRFYHGRSFCVLQSCRGPKPSTRTAWRWRCSSFSLWTITRPASTSLSSKGRWWAIRESLSTGLVRSAMRRWDFSETKRYYRQTSAWIDLQVNVTCTLLCSVWSWRLSDWTDHTAVHHHDRKGRLEQHTGGPTAVSFTQKPQIHDMLTLWQKIIQSVAQCVKTCLR